MFVANSSRSFLHFHNFCKMFESSFLIRSPAAAAPTVGSLSCYYLYSALPPLGNLHFANLLKMLNARLGTFSFFFDSSLPQLCCDCVCSKFAIPWTFASWKQSALRPRPGVKVTIIRPRCISIMSETIRATHGTLQQSAKVLWKAGASVRKLSCHTSAVFMLANLITFSVDPLKYQPCNASSVFRGR